MSSRTTRVLLKCVVFLLGLTSCAYERPIPITSNMDPGNLARGAQLVHGLAACGFCHGETSDPNSTLAGGRMVQDRYGELHAPNITPSNSGIGNWSTRQIIRAVRQSLGKNETELSVDVHYGYNWMSDEDMLAIASYLKSIPPIEKRVERRSIGVVDRYTTGLLEKHPGPPGYVPSLRREGGAEYGRYLLENVARCHSCHSSPGDVLNSSEYLAGGRSVEVDGSQRVAPNISGSEVYGIGDWKQEQIVQFLRSGQTPDGRFIDTKFCPVPFYKNADEKELTALARYLKSLDDAS